MDKTWAFDWVSRTLAQAINLWRESEGADLVPTERSCLRTMARTMWGDAASVARDHGLSTAWGTSLDAGLAIGRPFALASWNQPSPVKKAA